MPYDINQREVDAVFGLPGYDRYEYFLQRVADWGEVWGLANGGGWIVMGDSYGHRNMPLWPHAKYAQALAADDWGDGKPKPMGLRDFLAESLPEMARGGLFVAVFPSRDRKVFLVDPLRLKRDLERESER